MKGEKRSLEIKPSLWPQPLSRNAMRHERFVSLGGPKFIFPEFRAQEDNLID